MFLLFLGGSLWFSVILAVFWLFLVVLGFSLWIYFDLCGFSGVFFWFFWDFCWFLAVLCASLWFLKVPVSYVFVFFGGGGLLGPW